MWRKAAGCLQVVLAATELRFRGFHRVCGALLQRPTEGPTERAMGHPLEAADLDRARRLHHVLLASNRLTCSTCLSRSVVLCRSLRRRGIPAWLVLGASGGDDFSAHAWVEIPGARLGAHDSRAGLSRQGFA